MSPRAGSGGFSLIEVLVALALFSLLFLVLSDGLSLGVRALDRIEVAADRLEIRRSLDATLRRELETLHPGAGGTGEQARIAFDGEATAMSFLSLGPPGAPGLARLRLRFESGPQGRRLMLERFPAFGSTQAPIESTILSDQVQGFALAYYGVLSPDPTPRWYQTWREAPALPELIRVTLTLGHGSDPWPDLIVAPKARFAAR